MTTIRLLCAATLVAALVVPAAQAQPGAKPGPEHEYLKKMVGTWDTTMKMPGMPDSKGTCVYKMDLGGLWLVSNFESAMGDGKFSGRGYDTYDASKKKYVGVWLDSMSTSPMTLEGTFDESKKKLVMTGDGPGHDGKPTKYKAVSEMPDDNTINFAMYVGDGKDPGFTIVYKRKK